MLVYHNKGKHLNILIVLGRKMRHSSFFKYKNSLCLLHEKIYTRVLPFYSSVFLPVIVFFLYFPPLHSRNWLFGIYMENLMDRGAIYIYILLAGSIVSDSLRPFGL